MSANLQNQNGEGGGEEDRADHCFDARCSTDDSRCGSCKKFDAFYRIELTEAHLLVLFRKIGFHKVELFHITVMNCGKIIIKHSVE